MNTSEFTYDDYHDACNLALNFPDDLRLKGYDEDKDLFRVEFFVKTDAWYVLNLTGSLIRACIKGNTKKWI